jgi:Carbohydrate binding domain
MIARLLPLIALSLAATNAPADELLINAGFEQSAAKGTMPESWRGDTSVYSVDRTVKRSGEASLKYENAQPDRYRLASQIVPLLPGRKYRFSVWIKTDQIAGQESGATICLEWPDKDGKWMGGNYPSGVKGTKDWTRVEGVVRIPKEAGAVNLQCYVRKGMTGTAWFDDVTVEQILDPPMRTVLLSPNYRGRITSEGPENATLRVHLDLTDYDFAVEDLELAYLLRSPERTRLDGRTGVTPSVDGPTDLRIPLPALEPGRYDLAIHLLGPDQKVLQESKHTLERVADDFQPTCTIDPHGRLLVEGKPFLPLGMYWSSIKENELKTYADSKFNCLMPYGSPNEEQMDLAHRHGMKVIYSVKDFYAGSGHAPGFIKTEADEKPNVLNRVERFHDHPALLAWYLNDELSQSFMPRLEAHQQWIVEADPNHPTWVVLYQFREVGAYINTFDVIGTDPYPIGRAPASEAAVWTAETRRQVDGARPMWQVPQLHNWINYRKDDGKSDSYRTPTYDEMRSMAWQCLCEGATGLIFYSWYDMRRNPDVPFDQQWSELKRIAAEIDEVAPILLSVDEAPVFNLEVGDGTHHRPEDAPSWLHHLVRMHDGKAYIFAVNDGDGAGQVRFQLPNDSAWRIGNVRDMTNNRTLELSQAGFVDDFKPLSVHVYEVIGATD